MSWKNLAADVQAEFDQRFAERTEAIMEAIYRNRLAEWSAYGRWWDKTSKGRASNRARCRKAYKKREAIVVAERRCQCGASFKVNKNRPRKKVCAATCRFMRQRPPALFWNGLAVSDMARAAGVQYQTMKYRFRAGWPFELALSTPNRSRRVAPKRPTESTR
jgi:hypothetical protein